MTESQFREVFSKFGNSERYEEDRLINVLTTNSVNELKTKINEIFNLYT